MDDIVKEEKTIKDLKPEELGEIIEKAINKGLFRSFLKIVFTIAFIFLVIIISSVTIYYFAVLR